MKKAILFACLGVFLSAPRALWAQTPESTPSLSDLKDEIQQLKDELNQLEVKTEMSQGQAAKVQKSTFGLAGGSLEQDFESNNNTWGLVQGQTLNLKFFAEPSDNLKANLNLQFWGYVAQDLTQFSDLSNLASQNIFFAIRELDVTMDTGDLAFQAFKGMGYGGYLNSYDDLYYLFPDTYDVDKPFRYTGNSLPFGMNVKGERDLSGFEIWAGPQLQWGAQPAAYVMYQHKLGPITLGGIEKLQMTGFSQGVFGTAPATVSAYPDAPGIPITTLQNAGTQPVTNITTTELFLKVPIGDSITLDNVGLYDPSQINASYTYVQQVASGAGTFGSNYNILTATTSQTDALGYQGKITYNMNSVFDTIMVEGEYSGILAGNRERAWGEVSKTAFPNGLFTADATWQQPIVGPNPEILDKFGTIVVAPRNPLKDVFAVTSNPISGFNDREMTQFRLSFVYNPGAGWFFRYNPNDFGGYNINTDLDTPFSFGIMGTLTNYPTGTDGFSYVNLGVLTPDNGLGQAPTNGYQPYITSWTMWRLNDIHWVLDVEGGYNQSALSYSSALYPYTNSIYSSLMTRINNTSFTLGYGYDNYGPEDWNRQFGDAIGNQYLVQLTQKFGNSSVSLKYVEWDRLTDVTPQGSANPGVAGPVTSILYNFTLPLQEFYATYAFNF